MSVRRLEINVANQAEVLATWHVFAGALLVVGHSRLQIPKAGSARSGSRLGVNGVFKAESWVAPGHGFHAFVAVVRLADNCLTTNADQIILRGSRSNDQEISLFCGNLAVASDFGNLLAEVSRQNEASVAKFLVKIISLVEADQAKNLKIMLELYLDLTAKQDGCVELILELPDNRLILQGWGGEDISEETAIVCFENNTVSNLSACEFDRDDISLPHKGCIITFMCSDREFLYKNSSVYFIKSSKLFRRIIIEHRILIGSEAVGQFRHIYPRLRCSTELQSIFADILKPVFEDRDTLTGGRWPIKSAVDLTIAVSGVGIYLSGWILDLQEAIQAIHLRCGDDSYDLKDLTVLSERPDVLDAFSEDISVYNPQLTNCGFNVFIAMKYFEGSRPYLQFKLRESELAFLPLRIRKQQGANCISDLLKVLDYNKASFPNVIANAVGPLVKKTLSTIEASQKSINRRAATSTEFALVVVVHRGGVPRSIISLLMREEANESEQVLFLFGAGASEDSIVRTRKLLELYRLKASIIQSVGVVSPITGLLDALCQLGAEKLLVVSENCCGLSYHARSQLYQGLDHYDAVSPTILFADGSIKSVGQTIVETSSKPPYISHRSRYSGMSCNLAGILNGSQRVSGSLDCCAIKLDAVERVAEMPLFLTMSIGELAFFRKFESLGLRCKWDSAISVISPTEDEQEGKVERIVDGWMFADGECA